MAILATICLCMLVACTFTASEEASVTELNVGDKAPVFKLKGSDGKTYELKKFKGKQVVVITWFPKAFTGG